MPIEGSQKKKNRYAATARHEHEAKRNANDCTAAN